MQNRILSGWRLFVLAATALGLALLPAADLGAATSVGLRSSQPEDDGIEKLQRYSRSTYVWPFATGPVYGLRDLSGVDPTKPGILRTMVGTFDLTKAGPNFPGPLTTTVKLGEIPVQYFVLQVHPDVMEDGSFVEFRQDIEAQGGEFMAYLPIGGWIVRLNSASYGAASGQPGVIALMPYHPAFKLAPNIGRVPLPNPERAMSEVYKLRVGLHEGEDAGIVAQALADMGGNVTLISSNHVIVDVHRDKLAAIAALEPVHSVAEEVPTVLMGEETTAVMQTGECGGEHPCTLPYHWDDPIGRTGTKIQGENQLLFVLDSGIQVDAGDLSHTKTTTRGDLIPGNGHRKVEFYDDSTAFPGGGGDTLGCDQNNGNTHGHVVSATALGWATNVEPGYIDDGSGVGWLANDDDGQPWDLDGVAPRARVIARDAQTTPASGNCNSPLEEDGGIQPGTLYDSGAASCPACGQLEDAYNRGAKISNFSFGQPGNNTYTAGSQANQVDEFLFDFNDAMVFISAGNEGSDTDDDNVPDPLSVAQPATSVNAIVVGATHNANDTGADTSIFTPDVRASFSSVGPATPAADGTTNATTRIAPLIMAPGADSGGMGNPSEFACRTNDNTTTDASVECDLTRGSGGTSFSSPAAAGTALLMRDYFAQGYFPSGEATSGDEVSNLSGALIKALMAASADYLEGRQVDGSPAEPGQLNDLLSEGFRFNVEQGYGRVQLDNVLPLSSWSQSPTGLQVSDVAGLTGRAANMQGLSGTLSANETETTTLKVNSDQQELRIACAWIDPDASTGTLQNDIDIELTAPDNQTLYFGNYYSEDRNANDLVDTDEDCDGDNGIDEGQWSLEVFSPAGDPEGQKNCSARSALRDTANPIEAIHLSPDPDGNGIEDDPGTPGIDEGEDNQIVTGDWTLDVIGKANLPANPSSRDYACVATGGLAVTSTVRFDRGRYKCNDEVLITVNETDDSPGPPTVDDLEDAIVVQVLDGASVVDEEIGCGTSGLPSDDCIDFTQLAGTNTYESDSVLLTDGTARSSSATYNNGVIDIRSGEKIRVEYDDNGETRFNEATINCRAAFGTGGIRWSVFGFNTFALVDGGCDRNERGDFTFGFPDQYMDEGEKIGYRIAFSSQDAEDLVDVEATLSCVLVDANSPRDTDGDGRPDCIPGVAPSGACTDPDRNDNPPCTQLTILDSPKVVGNVPVGQPMTANFTVEVADSITGECTNSAETCSTDTDCTGSTNYCIGPKVEMILELSARKSGKPVSSKIVQREVLDVDELALLYSTDFPNGGSEVQDWDSDEIEDNPTTLIWRNTGSDNFLRDYRFESITWDALTDNPANSTAAANMPWDFETNNGGFLVGQHNATTAAASSDIALWGEDKNFNNDTGETPESGEDRDPVNSQIDNNWSTLGGCGWQSSDGGTGSPGGAWHSGRIFSTTNGAACLDTGIQSGKCQVAETLPQDFNLSQNLYWELLKTPVLHQVNEQSDDDGDPIWNVEITNVAWNGQVDLADEFSLFGWSFDSNTERFEPFDLNVNGLFGVLGGEYGARSGGNAPITDGFYSFAPINEATGANENGTVGNDRVGFGSCYFETSAITGPLGLSEPPDDDDNQNDQTCSANAALICDATADCDGLCDNGRCDNDSATRCSVDADCDFGTCGANAGSDTSTDDFVTQAGPLRNSNFEQINGPDLRLTTIEDLFNVPSGPSFQAAWSMIIVEGTPLDTPIASYGATIDDPVIEWKETRLQRDQQDCDPLAGGGQCAAIELASTLGYQGRAVLNVRIVDPYPYDTSDPVNDCNDDGDFDDVGIDDTDCNNNTIDDIVATVTTSQEPFDTERLILDKDGSSDVYEGNLPISSAQDVPDVLFLAPAGLGSSASVRVQYFDRDDGTGNPCPNELDPASEGTIEDVQTIQLPTENVIVTGYRIDAPVTQDSFGCVGDGDPFADADETVCIYLTVANKSPRDLDGIVSTIATNDDKVDCVKDTVINVGTLLEGQRKEAATPFVVKIKDTANRSSVSEDFSVTFNIAMASGAAGFDALTFAQSIDVDLDLNISGGSPTTDFTEDWDDLSAWTTDDQDAGKPRNEDGSEGFRCQYNDPDFPNSNSYGETDCFLGFENAPDNGYDWQLWTTANSDNGRAYTNNDQSLHWGFEPTSGDPADLSMRLRQIDAIETTDPIYLGSPALGSAGTSELSFKHQVSVVDSRTGNSSLGEAFDRAVVHVQLDQSDGTWIKVEPFENVYDVSGADNFINCLYDPTDDGNDEDSFFDPDDPNRRLGPSSTCWPELVYGWQGNTDYRSTFSASNIGRASDGPGLNGATNGGIDRGTWIETKFDLSRFAGRGARVRFLATTLTVEDAVTYRDAGWPQNTDGDDGWWIDDVRVTNVLAGGVNAPDLTVDGSTTDYGTCGSNCTTLTADLLASPPTLSAPGQVVELDAGDSFLASGQKCLDGVIQYRFFDDANTSGSFDTGELLRDWTDNSVFVDAPLESTTYGVDVRCSSAPTTCTDTDTNAVSVECPSDGLVVFGGSTGIQFRDDGVTLEWPDESAAPGGCSVDVIRGCLDGVFGNCTASLNDSGDFPGTVDACVLDNAVVDSYETTFSPGVNESAYWMVRHAACNGTWSTLTAKEDNAPNKRDDSLDCP